MSLPIQAFNKEVKMPWWIRPKKLKEKKSPAVKPKKEEKENQTTETKTPKKEEPKEKKHKKIQKKMNCQA